MNSPKPTLSIVPTSGWQAINLPELWQFRDLLTTLAQRDVKLRYRQTSLGVLWVILQPLLVAGIFSFQLKEAGFRVISAFDVAVEHHFEESRLARTYFLKFAEKRGEGIAYVSHHWTHSTVAFPRVRLVKRILRLWYWRVLRRAECKTPEGMPIWEMAVLSDIHFYKQYLRERSRPRNYEKNGLVKHNPEVSPDAAPTHV